MTSLYEEIQAIRALYPEESESAVLPALRLAQQEHGWLSPEVLRDVADALETTPAYCKSIASFYDQFHLAPIGEHLVEVCTNVSCAVVGAQQVVEAFESELGCHVAAGRVPRRLRLGHDRRSRPPLPHACESRGRAGDRRGVDGWRLRSS